MARPSHAPARPAAGRVALGALLLALAALLLPAPGASPRPAAAAPADFTRIEKEIAEEKAKAAKAWLGLALDLVALDLKDEATDAWRRARDLVPEHPDLAAVEAKVDALAGKGVADEAAQKRIARTREEVAKGYERMAKVLDKEQQDARFTAWLVGALELSPTKARVTTLARMAQAAPLLLQVEEKGFGGWLSLPKGWRAGNDIPLLVAFEGEGQMFQQLLERFARERKGEAVAVLAPLTLSSSTELKVDRYAPAYSEALLKARNETRNAFDHEGVARLVEVVRTHFAGTGPTWLAAQGRGVEPALGYLALNPGKVAAASLAQGRFESADLPGSEAPAGGGPPVELVGPAGGPEEPEGWLAARGFQKVAKAGLKGTGPSELAAQQWAWLVTPR